MFILEPLNINFSAFSPQLAILMPEQRLVSVVKDRVMELLLLQTIIYFCKFVRKRIAAFFTVVADSAPLSRFNPEYELKLQQYTVLLLAQPCLKYNFSMKVETQTRVKSGKVKQVTYLLIEFNLVDTLVKIFYKICFFLFINYKQYFWLSRVVSCHTQA